MVPLSEEVKSATAAADKTDTTTTKIVSQGGKWKGCEGVKVKLAFAVGRRVAGDAATSAARLEQK
jgi:hypothetical protein